jgi:diguanylate cyclase (GGDEF)-like protein
MDLSTISAIVQVAIIILVAALLHELSRVMSLRFLAYWSRGWLALAVGLTALVASFRLQTVFGEGNFGTVGLMMVYCFAEYLFGYLLWLGCRNYADGQRPAARDAKSMAAFAGLAVALPLAFPHIDQLFPCHAAVMACFFAIAAIESRAPTGEATMIGGRVLRFALAGLAVLFAHYAFLIGWFAHAYPNYQLVHMEYSSLYDATLEVGLAFGMVLLGTERVRRELEERNRRLAEAAESLGRSARTDPLTGLLNRLAFEELKSDPAPVGPSGCVAVIDLNDLKPLNDRHGHRAGDVALQLVARSLRIHARVTDPIYRLGGDEFAVVLPECPLAELHDRLAQIDAALAGQRLPGIESPVDIAIAWGGAAYDSPVDFFAAVAAADDAMYDQKAGRKGSIRSRETIVL